MKRNLVIAMLVTGVYMVTNGFVLQVTAENLVENLINIFKKGDSVELAKHFNPNVELEILEEENIYSKAQAELLMKDFFSKNKPSSFRVSHQGTKGNNSFAIGSLVTSTGTYRVSIFMNADKSQILIHQLRIEKS